MTISNGILNLKFVQSLVSEFKIDMLADLFEVKEVHACCMQGVRAFAQMCACASKRGLHSHKIKIDSDSNPNISGSSRWTIPIYSIVLRTGIRLVKLTKLHG